MSSSFSTMAGNSTSFIRLSPTSFFKSISSDSAMPIAPSSATPLASITTVVTESSSPVNGLVATPKSHHRKTSSRVSGSNPNNARKKLCYPDEIASTPMTNESQALSQKKATPKVSATSRIVSFVPKSAPSNRQTSPMKSAKQNIPVLDALFDVGGTNQRHHHNSREKQCQSAPVSTYDSFSNTNIYATPPRHSLRRQQSASATMVSVGGGRYVPSVGYRSNTAYARFTPPIGEDVSALFAGSKFSDSPSAKSLPMPPSHWLDELKVKSPTPKMAERLLKHVTEEEHHNDSDVVFHLDSAGSTSPVQSVIAEPAKLLQSQHSNVSNGSLHDAVAESQLVQGVEGIRLHPLQLIAAVAAS